jgi:hypothetical protein
VVIKKPNMKNGKQAVDYQVSMCGTGRDRPDQGMGCHTIACRQFDQPPHHHGNGLKRAAKEHDTMRCCGKVIPEFCNHHVFLLRVLAYRNWRIGSVEYLQISVLCFHFNLPRVIDGEFDHMILNDQNRTLTGILSVLPWRRAGCIRGFKPESKYCDSFILAFKSGLILSVNIAAQ